MSKRTGGAVAKLSDKRKRMGTAQALGTIRAVVTRTNSTFHEKRVALEHHKWLIQEHAINLGCRVTNTKKDGSEQAVVFRGDGLPEEVTRKVKTNAERAKEDKRAPIKSEVREGWKPERYRTKWMLARGL
jgi:hypothetical protein